MSSVTFGQKVFQAKPPEKGSFPLDHEGECHHSMLLYMKCLYENNMETSSCRPEAKTYLECRMAANLMAKEEWSHLGFKESTPKQSNDSR